jgi:hypothetical protein
MRESPIELPHVELAVGDSVRVDDQILTVLDICEDEVTFRIDAAADVDRDDLDTGNLETIDFGSDSFVCHGGSGKRLPPR